MKAILEKLKGILKYILVALAGIAFVALFLTYILFVSKTLTDNVIGMLDEVIVANVKIIDAHFKQDKEAMVNHAVAIAALAEKDALENSSVTAYIQSVAENSAIPSRIVVSTTTGDSFASDGSGGNLSSLDAFKTALAGNPNLSFVPQSNIPSENDIIVISAPIIKENETIGVLSAVYSAQRLWQSIPANSDVTKSLVAVVNSNGEVVSIANGTTQDNFDKMISSESLEKIKSLAISGKSEFFPQSKEADETENPEEAQEATEYISCVSMNDGRYSLVFLATPTSALSYVSSTFGLILVASGVLVIVALLAVAGFMLIKMRNRALLEHSAYYDRLTDIPNENILESFFKKNRKHIDEYAYLHLHINNFSFITATFGYETANNILIEIAHTLNDSAGERELAVKLREQSFGLLYIFDDSESFQKRIDSLVEKLHSLQITDGRIIFGYNCSYSIGMVNLAEYKYTTFSEVKKRAKLAQVSAAQNEMVMAEFGESMDEGMRLQSELISDVDKAFTAGEIIPYMQPRYEVTGMTVVSAEVYARWKRGDEIVKPGVFLPVMEASGLVQQLDLYMMEQACKMVNTWLQSENMPVPISVNISKVNLFELNFVESIISKVNEMGTPPSLIDFQFRQKDLILNEKKALAALTSLHEKGFVVTIDNFAEDEIPLELLYRLPIDIINISWNFVNYAMDNADIEKIFSTIIKVAEELNIMVSASAVETDEQKDFVIKHGCSLIQGRICSEAKPISEFETMIF